MERGRPPAITSRSCGDVSPRTSFPSRATEICAVSSLTTITSASLSSDEPERRAMARAERALDVLRLRERKDAASPDDRVAPNDHGAIVQRRIRSEDRREQVRAHLRLHLLSALYVVAERDFTLERDDAPDPGAAQALHRIRDLLGDLAHFHAAEKARHA